MPKLNHRRKPRYLSPSSTTSIGLNRNQEFNVIYQVFFRADRKNPKMTAQTSNWLKHFQLLWNRWTEFTETRQEASQHPLPSLCFWGLTGSTNSASATKFVFFKPIRKKDDCPGLWLAETFSTSSLKPQNGIWRNLTGSNNSTSSAKFVFSGRLEKQDGHPASDWHFGFLLWKRWKDRSLSLSFSLLEFYVTCNDISVIYRMWRHRCAGGLKKKLYLR